MLRRSDAPILRRSDEKNVGKHNQDRSPKTAKPTSELILKERTKKNKEKQRKKQKPRKEKKREKKTRGATETNSIGTTDSGSGREKAHYLVSAHYHQLAHLQFSVTRWGFTHTRGWKLLLTREPAGKKKNSKTEK